MIGILAQERILGGSLGSVFAGVIVFKQGRDIYNTISPNQPKSQIKEPNYGKKSEFPISHYWNKAVDQTFAPAIEMLSSRKW